MSFLNPTYLWALLGLCIPIIIHLWSKKEGRTIKVGSLKLLQEEDSKQSNSIQLHEYLLLLLRLLIIAIVVLILANPIVKQYSTRTPLTYLIEPELLENTQIASVLDTLRDKGELRLLQTGFPEVTDDIIVPNTPPNYWHLVQQIGSLQTDSIIIYTQGRIQGIKGKRPTISEKVSWITLDNDISVDQPLIATQVGDSVRLIRLRSDDQVLAYTHETYATHNSTIAINKTKDSIIMVQGDEVTLSRKQKKQTAPLLKDRTINVAFVVEDTLIDQFRFLEAAFKGISKYMGRTITITKLEKSSAITEENFDGLVWLSTMAIKDITIPLLRYQPDPLATSLIVNGESQKEFYLTRFLTLENSIKEHIAEQLLPFLDPYLDIESQIAMYDQRVIDNTNLRPIVLEKNVVKAMYGPKDISHWLWGVLCIIIIGERFVARYRRQ